MARRLRTVPVLKSVLVTSTVHLSGLKRNATMTANATGFTITVAMVKTGDFAQMVKLMATEGMVDVRK